MASVTQIRHAETHALRRGFTTGACATAAALAAIRWLCEQSCPTVVTIDLPVGEQVEFAILPQQYNGQQAQCAVVKDGGDDPDCTHGALIQVAVAWSDTPGIQFRAGPGVATVTLPGLELPVGEPAINPVPRQMIRETLAPWLASASQPGVTITVSVPDGEERAKQTINARLGLLGGISILGTRGTVKPFSTSAFAASVRQTIQVGRRNGETVFVLTTGGRTEKAAQRLYPALPERAFVQAGDFVGIGLRTAVREQCSAVVITAMIGKLAKMAQGHFMTHVSGAAIQFAALADLLAPDQPELHASLAQAHTGRHVLELLQARPNPQFYWDRLCQQTAQETARFIKYRMPVTVHLVDFQGQELARASLATEEKTA